MLTKMTRFCTVTFFFVQLKQFKTLLLLKSTLKSAQNSRRKQTLTV